MNWLAHLVLSEPQADFRIGNLLPDFLPMGQLAGLPTVIAQGVHRHRQIDAYTDAHPVVLRCAARFAPPLRRFGKVLTDVFFDHFLARDWSDYSSMPLAEFLENFYRATEDHRSSLPPLACLRLDQLRRYNWMADYGRVEGITHVLQRMGARLRRPVDLVPAMRVLEDRYEDFQNDFEEFFPDIRKEVAPTLKFPLIG